MRKHRHLPHCTKRGAEWPRDIFGRLIPIPQRRAHGIFKDVAPTPNVIATAKKRAFLYMHAAARRWAQAEALA